MQKVKKEDVIILMAQLRQKGYSQEELAVKLGRTQQTIWAWGSKVKPDRVPCISEFEALQGLLGGC